MRNLTCGPGGGLGGHGGIIHVYSFNKGLYSPLIMPRTIWAVGIPVWENHSVEE